MSIDKSRVRAKTPCGAQWHGRVDSVLARFITGGGDDAALIRTATDHDGLTAQLGALEQFHGNEEGVHIHVENGGMEGNLARFRRVMLGAKTGQVRHGISLRLGASGGNRSEDGRTKAVLRKFARRRGPGGYRRGPW